MPWLGIRGNRTLSHALPRKFRLGDVDLGRLGPDSHLGRDPNHIGKFPCFQPIPDLSGVSVAGIDYYHSVRQSPTADLVYHLQCYLPLLLELDFLWDSRFRPTLLISNP